MAGAPSANTYYNIAIIASFRAGRSNLVDNKLVSDPRKGIIEVFGDQDGLVHFTWKQRGEAAEVLMRTTGLSLEVDVVLLPGEATFRKVPDRRIFILKHGDEQLFFWSQESDTNFDDELCKTVNQCLLSTSSADAITGDSDDAMEDEPAHFPSTSATQAASQPVGSTAAIQASQLAHILGNMQQHRAETAPAVDARALAAALGSIGSGGVVQQQQQRQMLRAPGPSLAEVLTPEVLLPLLREPGTLERLAPFLPEEHRNEAALIELGASAQLHHQLSVLGSALQTAQLDPAHFGLTATGYTTVEFLESIQRKVDEEQEQQK